MSSMDQPDSPGGGRPPRKELQGPRPTPLKVRKESHKIKKPPMGPSHNQQPPPQPPRQPVVIYTVSPTVIHTNPSEFMTLVQRLTGPDATSSSQHHPPPPASSFSSSSSFSIAPSSSSGSSMVGGCSSSVVTNHSTAHHQVSGAVSPAARLASIEKTKMHPDVKRFVGQTSESTETEINTMDLDHGIGRGDSGGDGGNSGCEGAERTVVFPGILSPGPGSLLPISPKFFSPLFQHDPNNLINLQQQYGNKSVIEGSHLPSPFSTNLFTPSPMFSPSSLDFLQRVWDS